MGVGHEFGAVSVCAELTTLVVAWIALGELDVQLSHLCNTFDATGHTALSFVTFAASL